MRSWEVPSNIMYEDKINYYLKKLRKNDFRVTPQRRQILQVLSNSHHPTARDITDKVQQDFPTTQPLTIYRTLDLIKEIGELISIDTETSTKYELASTTHPHFICENTGEVKHIDDPAIERKLKEFKNLAPDNTRKIELNFYGVCPDDKELNT